MRKYACIYAISAALLLSLCTPLLGGNDARSQAENLFVQAQKELSDGNISAAETLLKESLKKDPTFTSAIWQLAQVYEKQGRLEFARELMIRGLEIDPHATWARGRLKEIERSLLQKLITEANTLASSGQYGKAIPKLSLYLGIKPDDTDALTLLARCHLALGNLEVARDYLIDAIKIDPSNLTVASLIDRVEEKINANSVSAMVTKAKSLLADYSPENAEQAKKLLISILNKDPENTWAKEKLSELNLIIEQNARDEAKTKEKQEIAKKSVEMASALKNALTRMGKTLKGNLTNIILVLFSILLFLNIRKRVVQKDYPLQGSLSLIPVLDIVSLINSNLKTGRMVIEAQRAKGEIFFEKGEIVHARWKGYDGKKAFHKLMEVKSGKFFFINHLPKIRHTISEPLSLLLLSMPAKKEPQRIHEEQVEAEELFTH